MCVCVFSKCLFVYVWVCSWFVHVLVCKEGYTCVGVPEVNLRHLSSGVIYSVLETGSLSGLGLSSWPVSSSSGIVK